MRYVYLTVSGCVSSFSKTVIHTIYCDRSSGHVHPVRHARFPSMIMINQPSRCGLILVLAWKRCHANLFHCFYLFLFLCEIDIIQYRAGLVNSIVFHNDLQFNPKCLKMSSPVGYDFQPVCTHTKLQWLTCDVVKLKKHERWMSRSQDSVP